MLAEYGYPGNIRELESVMLHAVTMADEETIMVRDLPEHVAAAAKKLPPADQAATLLTLAELEKQHIVRTLEAVNDNRGAAAKKLGVSRSTLWRKLKELRIK